MHVHMLFEMDRTFIMETLAMFSLFSLCIKGYTNCVYIQSDYQREGVFFTKFI